MANVPFSTSAFGRQLKSAAGTLRGMKACSAGTSHMTATNGLGYTFQYCLARYHNADIYFNTRGVLTSVADPTVIANRGSAYATPSAGSSHMVGAQLTQFNTDIAAGMRYDLLFIDGGVYNDSPTTQAMLETAITRTETFLTAFFDPAGNAGVAAIVWGLFGLNPTLCKSWANHWRWREINSNGRIRFLDAASALINAGGSTATTWAWKGGTAALGAATTDGTHVSGAGARAQAALLAPILQDICPRKMNWPGGMACSAYNPSTTPWADVLGNGAAMLGTGGIDKITAGGTFSGDIPGDATGGYTDKWGVSWTGAMTKPTFAIGPNANGDREFSCALSGNANAGDFLRLDYQPTVTNVNNSVATRKFLCGIEVELSGVTGLNEMFMRQAGVATWDTPINGSGAVADGLPDTTSETWLFRSPYPVAWTGNNPTLSFFLQFRAKTGIAGTLKFRKPFFCLAEE